MSIPIFQKMKGEIGLLPKKKDANHFFSEEGT